MADPITSYLTGKKEAAAANNAAQLQSQAADRAMDATQEAQKQQQQILDPYVQAGLPAISSLTPFYQAGTGALGGLSQYSNAGAQGLQGQQNIIGLGGAQAQQAEYQNMQNSPAFQEMQRAGQNAMLQNASATGGLRGGNTQAALAQFSPQLLNDLIEQQYSRYGGLAAQGGNVGQFLAGSAQNAGQNVAQLGQASAAGTGAGQLQSAAQVADLMSQQGSALAGGALAQARPYQQANAAFQNTLNQAGNFLANKYG